MSTVQAVLIESGLWWRLVLMLALLGVVKVKPWRFLASRWTR